MNAPMPMTTTIEWNVLDNGEPYLQPWTEDEDEARSYLRHVTGPPVCRARVRYNDYVGPWFTDAPTPTAAGGGDGAAARGLG